MFSQLKEFFTFPRRQRNGIVVLLLLILLVVTINISLPYWVKNDVTQDVEKFREEIAAFEAQLQPISENPDSFSINLNTATAEELQAIKGIGPLLAQTIVQQRNEFGDFQQVDSLLKVKGIGPASLQKIAPYVFVISDTTPAK